MLTNQKSYAEHAGVLYLVPTPIGNLDDMTYRSIQTLRKADHIASEDTRNTQKLLNHFDIKVPQISLHEHNYKERIPQLLQWLYEGEVIAQVSDAGMPSISDPGHELVEACIEANIPVISLPGATAGVTALIASGIQPQPYLFYGFLPRKHREVIGQLEQLKGETATLIFYESPYRIATLLNWMKEVFDIRRSVCLCRELTKIHEEYIRGTLEEVSNYCQEHTIKGECCLIVSGAMPDEIGQESCEDWADMSLKEQVEREIQLGKSVKESIKEVARRHQLKKQVVYNAYHEI